MCESVLCCEGFKHIILQTTAMLTTQFPEMTSENTVSSTVISLCLVTEAHKTQAEVCVKLNLHCKASGGPKGWSSVNSSPSPRCATACFDISLTLSEDQMGDPL